MSELEQRAAVVSAARSFIGTRYHSNGMIKGVGVDCATLLAMAFTEAGVRPPIQVGDYSSQWHLHSDDPLYEKAIVAQGGHQLEPDACQPGDIVLYFQGKQFAHGAIVSEVNPLRIIHAYAPSRCVVEGVENEFGSLAGVDKKIFSAW
jgi:cell wall-associated NlpC family hydrolase